MMLTIVLTACQLRKVHLLQNIIYMIHYSPHYPPQGVLKPSCYNQVKCHLICNVVYLVLMYNLLFQPKETLLYTIHLSSVSDNFWILWSNMPFVLESNTLTKKKEKFTIYQNILTKVIIAINFKIWMRRINLFMTKSVMILTCRTIQRMEVKSITVLKSTSFENNKINSRVFGIINRLIKTP